MYLDGGRYAAYLGATYLGLYPWTLTTLPPIYVNPNPSRQKRYYITRRGRVVR